MKARDFLMAGATACTLAPLALGRRGFALWPLGHAAVLYPTLRSNCAWFGPVVTRFETPRREVWLTIDDGPSPRDTPALLEVLADHDARATFFLIGRRVEVHRDLAWRIHRAGHQIGNHTHSHPSGRFWALGPTAMREEIQRGREAIFAATGCLPQLFRSPVGMTNPFVHPALEGQQLVGWSASGRDGLSARGETAVGRILRRLRPGAILVLHEGGAPGRVATVDLLLRHLREQGYRCVIPDPAAFR